MKIQAARLFCHHRIILSSSSKRKLSVLSNKGNVVSKQHVAYYPPGGTRSAENSEHQLNRCASPNSYCRVYRSVVSSSVSEATTTWGVSTRLVSSSSFEHSKPPSTRQEYQQFFAEFHSKNMPGISPLSSSSLFCSPKSIAARHASLTPSDREALRGVLDLFIALPPASEVRTPALVREACQIALAAGWPKRCCEVFFSSFPLEYLQQACKRFVHQRSQNSGGTEQALRKEDGADRVLHEQQQLLAPFLDLLQSLPSCVLRAAILLYEPSNAMNASSPRGTSDETSRYLDQCLMVIAYLVSGGASAAHSMSVERFVEAKKWGLEGEKKGNGASFAMRLYFHVLWEILLEELWWERASPEPRAPDIVTAHHDGSAGLNSAASQSSNTTSPSVAMVERGRGAAAEAVTRRLEMEETTPMVRVLRLREVAMDAAQHFGIRLRRNRTPPAPEDHLSDSIQEMDALNEMIDASLRLLRYRWESIVKGTEGVSSAGVQHAHPAMDASSHPLRRDPVSLAPRVAHQLFHDAMATVCSHLMRLFLQQEEGLVMAERRHPYHTPSSLRQRTDSPAAVSLCQRYVLHPEVYTLLMRSSLSARRWDIAEYVSLLMDQYWHTRCSWISAQDALVSSDGLDASTTSAATVQKAEEELVLQQLRFLLFSRQGKRALLWWSWLSEMTTVSSNHSPNQNNNSSAGSSTSAPTVVSLYPVPSIPVVTTLARIAGEFSTTNDYHVQSFRRGGPALQRDGGLRRPVVPHATQDPSALSLWCLETMLHIQQSAPPSGDALFLGVSACAKAGLPELDEVLRSLLVNDVLALTEEEVLHVRLLHCRRDVHWHERVGTLVPLLKHIPSLFHTLSERIGEATPAGRGSSSFKTPTRKQERRPKKVVSSPGGSIVWKKPDAKPSDARERVTGCTSVSSESDTNGTNANHPFAFSCSLHTVLPPFPYHDPTLSERNAFRILVLLQEGNDPRYLPFYFYVLDHFCRSRSGTPTPGSPVLSVDQQCRWLLLSLVYCSSNSQTLPQEWVWRVAAEALKHLRNGRSFDRTGSNLRRSSPARSALSSEELSEAEPEEEAVVDTVEAGDDESDLRAAAEVIVESDAGNAESDSHSSTIGSRESPTSTTGAIAPDTWYSLTVKWRMLYRQYPKSFWCSFLSALHESFSDVVAGGAAAESSKRSVIRDAPSSEEPRQWSRLLALPLHDLDPLFCRQSIEQEERQRAASLSLLPPASGPSSTADRGIFRFLHSRRMGKGQFLSPHAFSSAEELFVAATPPRQGLSLNVLLRRMKPSPMEAAPFHLEISADDHETLNSRIRLEWQQRVFGK